MKEIKPVDNNQNLNLFINFITKLYPKNSLYVLPFLKSVKKELNNYLFIKKTYKALLYIKDDEVQGRILYTFDYNEKLKQNVCYFSFFDFYDDQDVTSSLINAVCKDMKENNIFYIEGPFCPFDPDARRGVLTNYYDDLPALFNTYNYPYYITHYEKLGFIKSVDTICMNNVIDENVYKQSKRLALYAKKRVKVNCSYLNLNKIDDEINDIASILKLATTDINYQSAPDVLTIKTVFKTMKPFIKQDLIIIAREINTNRPIGFIVVLLDYNYVLKKMNGKFNVFTYLLNYKKIDRARGMLQYIIPEYQSTGLLAIMFDKVANNFKKYNIKSFEGGTIIENNIKSFSVFSHYGGQISKRYRIYKKELTK